MPDADGNNPDDGLQPTQYDKNWDQFAVNEKLFGVKTDFNEDLYTTKLDKNSEEYKRREKEAARLAREIEKARRIAFFHSNRYP